MKGLPVVTSSKSSSLLSGAFCTLSEHKNWHEVGWQQEIIQIYKMVADRKVNPTLGLPNHVMCVGDCFRAAKSQAFFAE